MTTNDTELVPGLIARTTPRGYRVLELDITADPAKRSPGYLEGLRRQLGDQRYRREVLRDWTISEGNAFFPEFAANGGPAFYVRPAGALLAGPVYRGLDLGERAPVCVWFQYSAESDRAWVLREFVPKHLHTHAFRDAVLYLSGELGLEDVEPGALEWIEAYSRTPDMPPPPWFAPGTTFESFAGPEVNRVESIAARDPMEATAGRVFAARGLFVSVQAGPVKAKETVLRRLLVPRSDGWPGILIDPACPNVVAMLNGGLTYPKITGRSRLGPSEDPRKDGHNDNVYDALAYGLVGVVPATETWLLPNVKKDEPPEQTAVGFYETRVRRGRW